MPTPQPKRFYDENGYHRSSKPRNNPMSYYYKRYRRRIFREELFAIVKKLLVVALIVLITYVLYIKGVRIGDKVYWLKPL